MRKQFLYLALCILVSGAALKAETGAKGEGPRAVILIGWDGVGRADVKAGLKEGALPNLKKLASQGNLVAIDVLRMTDTKAGWAQILTGYEPEVTGVFGNYRYGPIPAGYSVFERLEKHFGASGIFTGAAIAKKMHVDADPEQREPLTPKELEKLQKKIETGTSEFSVEVEGDVPVKVTPAKPYYLTQGGMDVFVNDLRQDKKVGEKAIELIEKHKGERLFLFVHFGRTDGAGHEHGHGSKPYRDAIVSADAWTGKIMKKLVELGLYKDTLIYVTADHGFDVGMKKHHDAPYVFLATNDPKVMRRGTRADIAPTILDRFGVDLESIDPPLDGLPLTRPYTPPIM